ncbi:hypothetical protein B9Z55_028582 [Caenorhabditis nigoni]|uniref:One cut domain family member n=1 Tax=Caenorhabditis nigoni TaxID=1611254 RepID=A0A2G5SBH6_9PELO|nr:hypothetical protein B9Z55_028582 [Caenorhabditis nigoni]
MGLHGKYVDYLQVDPSSTYINKYGPPQEELPDDFLDFPDSPKKISPECSSETSPTSDTIDFRSWEPVDFDISAYMKIVYEAEAEVNSSTKGVLSSKTLHHHSYENRAETEENVIVNDEFPGSSGINTDRLSDLENTQQNEKLSQQSLTNFGGNSIIRHQQVDIDDVLPAVSSMQISSKYDEQENQLDSVKALSKQKPKRVRKPRQAPRKDSDESENEEKIDTKDVAMRIINELKTHQIPQKTFAERILCRSQGTLSDLLRNPKPWNMLKSGQETFRRMHKWLQQPLTARLSILDMSPEEAAEAQGVLPPTPVPSGARKRRMNSDESEPVKVARFVFTAHQKQTLQSLYKVSPRPTRDMQQKLADHLEISLETVENFFMNARRRDRYREATQQTKVINEPIPQQHEIPQQQEAEILSEYETDDDFY